MQGIIRKDRSTRIAIYENYNKKLKYLSDKSNNMNMELKFASNMAPVEIEIENNENNLSQRSLSPGLNSSREIEYVGNKNSTNDMTKCLMK